MKIIDPEKKSNFIVRELHHFDEKFDSIPTLKLKLISEFGDQLPETDDFGVGYFIGKQSSKHWLVTKKDLASMYASLPKGKTSILLWCDGRSHHNCDTSEELGKSQKRKSSVDTNPPPPSKCKQLESDVDEISSELKDRHGTKYTLPQLRLWARMIVSGNHESMTDPPQIPAITGIQPKRAKRESLGEALVEAASTIVGALRTPEIKQSNIGTNNVVITSDTTATPPKILSNSGQHTGLSPGKVCELRSKKMQELRELQQLLEHNILTDAEFTEQKSLVLNSLRKLTH